MRGLLRSSRLYNFKNEKGASSVEFAILLPVLILILFGIFEFGLTYRDYLAITHAAREGARMAAVGEYSEVGVRERAYPVSPTAVSINYPTGAANHGDPVEVQVTYDRQLHIPLLNTNSVHLTSRARMRIEY